MTSQLILRKKTNYQIVHSTNVKNASIGELVNVIFDIPCSDSDQVDVWYSRDGYFGDPSNANLSYPLASYKGRFYSKVLFTYDTNLVQMLNSQNINANFIVTINDTIATNYHLVFNLY